MVISPKSPHLKARVTLYHRIAWSFLILTSILVVLILAMCLNRTTVIITRGLKPVATDFTIPIYEQAPNTEGTFLVGKFYTLELSKSTTITPTAGKTVNDYAHGIITITNTTRHNQSLIKTTRLLSPTNKLYRLTKSVTVPAQKSVDAEVQADIMGADEEITDIVKFTIPGLRADLQATITGTNKGPLVGGTRSTSTITEQDVPRAQQTLEDQLKQEATDAFTTQLATAQTPTSGKAISIKVLSFTNDYHAKKTTTSLTASMQIQATLFAFDQAALFERAQEHLVRSLPSGYMLYDADHSLFTYALQSPTGNADAMLAVRLEGASTVDPRNEQFNTQNWTNKSSDELNTILSKLDGVQKFSIHMTPAWVHSTSRDQNKITIQFDPIP